MLAASGNPKVKKEAHMAEVSSYISGIVSNITHAIFSIYASIVRFSPLPDAVDAIIIIGLVVFAVYKFFKLLLAR